MGRFLARTLVVASFALAAATASPAAAEVSVSPGAAVAGNPATLEFQVVNGRPDSSTLRVEVQFPEDRPLPDVTVRPKDGWRHETTRRTLSDPIDVDGREVTSVVDTIVWQAREESDWILPGEHDEFEVRVGRLPSDVDRLSFPTRQTYSDGQVQRWTGAPKSAGMDGMAMSTQSPEPSSSPSASASPSATNAEDDSDGPAPVLRLVKAPEGVSGSVAALAIGMASTDGDSTPGMTMGGSEDGKSEGMEGMTMDGTSGMDGMEGMDMASMDMSPASQDTVNLAMGLAIVGVFVGMLSGTFAGMALARARNRPTSPVQGPTPPAPGQTPPAPESR